MANPKSLFWYYIYIFAPLSAWCYFGKSIGANLFASGILFYALIYHPLISGIRLVNLGKIPSSDLFKNFIPLWNKQYFKTLFFSVK